MWIGIIALLSGHSWGLVLFVFAYFFMERDDDE
jgi:hypothetical protein